MWVQELCSTCLVAPRQVGSSQTRDPTGVPCIARQILNHWTEQPGSPSSAVLTTDAFLEKRFLDVLALVPISYKLKEHMFSILLKKKRKKKQRREGEFAG